MAKRTAEEVALIRPAFNSNGRSGILEMIVLARKERAALAIVDISNLKKKYADLGCVGAVALIEVLSSKKETPKEIGSGSIDFTGVTQGPFSIEGAMSLQELYIGGRRTGTTPLIWLAYLAEGIHGVMPLQRKAFDEICAEFSAISTALDDGNCREVDPDLL